ncbi:MAG: hypothetical protein BWY65_02064 [Firmicutes bacterium ADurb.Bin373]|nr:MAG: hypothetical protein BWY65_02064 [Firmicutes bacterium ADurb.Bin373]
MQNWEKFLMQRRTEINDRVPATDQVQPGKWGILDHVLPGENTHVADRLADLVTVFHPGKEAAQTPRRHIGRNVGRVYACPRFIDQGIVNIRGKNLYRRAKGGLPKKLGAYYCYGICFFAA